VDTAGGDDLDGLAGEGGGLALDELDDGGDEHGGGDVTGVAAALAALGADDVDAELEALLDVLGVADHVHVDDTGLVETVDDGAGGNADGGDEELGAGLDDDVNELVELAVRVVTAGRDKRVLANRPLQKLKGRKYHKYVLGLAGIATDLREKEIDTEGGVLVVEVLLELGNLLAKHVGGVADTTDDTETSGVGDGGGETGTGSDVHAGKEHGVLDTEELGGGSADLLCKGGTRPC